MLRILIALVQGLAVAAAVLASVGIVGIAVLAFLFTAATSASDPNEAYEPLMMFGFMVLTVGCIVGAWWLGVRQWRRQRSSS